jgi:hypothetical protein
VHAPLPAEQQHSDGESLTDGGNARTIRPMNRETLQSILRAADGITEKAGVFRVPGEHRVTFYLGSDGHSMVVNEVQEIKLGESFVTLATAEVGNVYTEPGAVYAVAIKPPKPNAPKKAGFA